MTTVHLLPQNRAELPPSLRPLTNQEEQYVAIAKGAIDLKHLKDYQKQREKERTHKTSSPHKVEKPNLEDIVAGVRGKTDMLVIGENLKKIDYKLSPCCTPIPGDDVFGFITINEGIKIHRVNCPHALELMSNYAYRIVKARWMNQELISFLAGIKVTGIDEMGIVNRITQIPPVTHRPGDPEP